MKNLIQFVKSTLLGGFIVILPLLILMSIISWAFNLITDILAPYARYFSEVSGWSETISTFVVGVFFVLLCFIIGYFVQTRLGRLTYRLIDSKLLQKIPFYKVIKETVSQFVGNDKSPFSSVALVRIFGNDTMVTAFVTDEHKDGSYTVFVPTGPNPTSGNIYHVKEENLIKLNANVDDTMKSIISCGAGSKKIMTQQAAI